MKSFWCVRVSGLPDPVYSENILPDGHHEIIFHLSANNAKRGDNESGWVNEPVSFFAGQTLTRYALELQNDAVLYGIRFYPHTLNLLFGFPADLITNTILPLQDIAPARGLADCISENQEETFRNLETALLKLCKGVDFSSHKSQYIRYSVGEILRHNGKVKIDRLVKAAGLSQKHFDTVFNQSVGINPKAFSNIIQLNYFVRYRNQHPGKSLTECCYEAEFFDQSHLVKLFRRVAGQSPKEYFREDNPISNCFSEL
nr:helix-turn-helix domain-containing protein [Flavihumibacter petaseus]